MTMQYRGITYQAMTPSVALESEVVEGIYHGLQTEIQLPQSVSQDDISRDEIVYRGVKMSI